MRRLRSGGPIACTSQALGTGSRDRTRLEGTPPRIKTVCQPSRLRPINHQVPCQQVNRQLPTLEDHRAKHALHYQMTCSKMQGIFLLTCLPAGATLQLTPRAERFPVLPASRDVPQAQLTP